MVSNLDVEIKCKASGEVVELPFDISDSVAKGQLLVKLDPIDEERAEKQARVALASSQARLAQARQNERLARDTLATERRKAEPMLAAAKARAERAKTRAARLKGILATGGSTEEECDAAQADAVVAAADVMLAQLRFEELKNQELTLELRVQDVKLAEAQVQSDQISLDVATQRLTDTKVSAPMAGVVSARNVQVGQIVSSGVTNIGGGTSVLTLSDLSRMFVLGAVDESDIGKVHLDDQVNVTADAFPGRRFKGKVVRVATKGVNISNVVTFEVKIEIEDPKKTLLKPEMTANLEVIANPREDALKVPTAAVLRKQGKQWVEVATENGATEERAVEVGIQSETEVEVRSGLKEGELVVLRKSETESRWRNEPGGPRPPSLFGGGGRR
jgi:HlyD family secretion protein